jgi:fluoride exporter
VIALWVAIGAAVGAPARYLTDRAIQARHEAAFPWGTFTVNLIACCVLGVVTGLAGEVSAGAAAVLGTGFCGALSTYSTFGFETMRLAQTRRPRLALGYVGASIVAGLTLAALGWWVATALV